MICKTFRMLKITPKYNTIPQVSDLDFMPFERML